MAKMKRREQRGRDRGEGERRGEGHSRFQLKGLGGGGYLPKGEWKEKGREGDDMSK